MDGREGEQDYLEGEEEYIDVQDDMSECGTQLDGDETSQNHESYNFTQLDENVYHPDPLLEEEEEEEEEGDPVHCCSDQDARLKWFLSNNDWNLNRIEWMIFATVAETNWRLTVTIISDVFCSADDEEIDFPDLAVTQTQLSHMIHVEKKVSARSHRTIIQSSDGHNFCDREVSAGERISTTNGS